MCDDQLLLASDLNIVDPEFYFYALIYAAISASFFIKLVWFFTCRSLSRLVKSDTSYSRLFQCIFVSKLGSYIVMFITGLELSFLGRIPRVHCD